MSSERFIDPMAEAAQKWARDFAAQSGVVFPFSIEVIGAGVTRTAMNFRFERPSEFAAARVVMSLIDQGQEVTVKVHADNWIRVSVSVENERIEKWLETWDETSEQRSEE
ncbi:hypothetical protein ABWK57_13970 [Streptomyces sp. NPDC094045]|uniref:hypothetical protein n=1 Tax=unclassified Streptomyces TaxID=2593676 RepID=UPI00339773FB